MTEEQQDEVVVVAEEQPQPKKRQRRVMVDVTIVAQEGESALVQWMKPDGRNVSRGYVDVADIKDGKCDKAVLKAAHPYGVPWGTLIDILHFNVTEQRIEDELHRRNIWTVADLENDTALATRSLMSIIGPIIGQLHQRGSDYERFEKEDEGG